MAHYHALCSLAFGCKFGFAEPENFDDEDGDYEEVEIEELRFDGENGSQRIKKIVKRSPASRLIIERCRQLELENAQLAEFMKIKIRVKEEKLQESKQEKKKNREKNKEQQQQQRQQRKQKTPPVNVTGFKEELAEMKGTSSSLDGSTESVAPGTSSSSTSSGGALSSSPTNSAKPERKKRNRQAKQLSQDSLGEQSTSSPSSKSASATSLNTDNKSKPSSFTANSSGDSAMASSTETMAPDSSVEPFKPNTWSEDHWKKLNYGVLLDDGEFCYVDFASRGRPSDVSTFRYQDYQWDDQGYSLCNLLYPDIGPFLDEKFKVGYNLTYYT